MACERHKHAYGNSQAPGCADCRALGNLRARVADLEHHNLELVHAAEAGGRIIVADIPNATNDLIKDLRARVSELEAERDEALRLLAMYGPRFSPGEVDLRGKPPSDAHAAMKLSADYERRAATQGEDDAK